MTSTQQGSSCNGSRGIRVGKGEKATRRTWSPSEEAGLITALKDLVSNGWKSDNGFRGGYLTRLEDALAREFQVLTSREVLISPRSSKTGRKATTLRGCSLFGFT